MFSVVCTEYSGPAHTLCTPIRPECSSFWSAGTFCIKCAQFSAAKRPQISAPGPGSGSGVRAQERGQGNSVTIFHCQ